jgi:hypothetical protein
MRTTHRVEYTIIHPSDSKSTETSLCICTSTHVNFFTKQGNKKFTMFGTCILKIFRIVQSKTISKCTFQNRCLQKTLKNWLKHTLHVIWLQMSVVTLYEWINANLKPSKRQKIAQKRKSLKLRVCQLWNDSSASWHI